MTQSNTKTFGEAALASLRPRVPEFHRQWVADKPFPYAVMNDFFPADFAEALWAAYPTPDDPAWANKTFAHQRHKLMMNQGFRGVIAEFFDLTASREFRALVTGITGIDELIDDPDLAGGGLHQIMRGGFLDVHVDFNLHPTKKLHRRLNLLYYLNKDWQPAYEGHLELWQFAGDERRRLESVAPQFNRAVLFETNEASYHGHPAPLNTPDGVTRKSMAIYYYTEQRDAAQVAPEHNTIYKQTTGLSGYAKTLRSSTRAALERVAGDGVVALGTKLADKVYRRARGLPPRNG